MKKEEMNESNNFFDSFASKITTLTGSSAGFGVALLIVLIWGISGPFFHFSENWQLVINTGTTIITFLMVFIIQKSQNKDSLAIQLKLNELVASHEFASNRLVNIENMSEDDLKIVQKYYSNLSEMTKKEENLQQSHSIDEARELHELKKDVEDKIKNSL